MSETFRNVPIMMTGQPTDLRSASGAPRSAVVVLCTSIDPTRRAVPHLPGPARAAHARHARPRLVRAAAAGRAGACTRDALGLFIG